MEMEENPRMDGERLGVTDQLPALSQPTVPADIPYLEDPIEIQHHSVELQQFGGVTDFSGQLASLLEHIDLCKREFVEIEA